MAHYGWVLAVLIVFLAPSVSAQSNEAFSAADQQCLRLGADETLSSHLARFSALFETLYARAGYCATSVPMNPKRLEQLMNSGELDGDWFRPAEYIATRSLQQQILPQAMFGLEARMIWLKQTGFSGNPEDLKGLTVGYRAGFRWLETHIPLMGAKPFAIAGGSQIKALLTHKRIDLYATSSVHEPRVFEAFGTDADKLTSAHWATEPFYHLLQERHADKIPALNTALRAMIDSGEIKNYLTMPGIVLVPTQGAN